MVKIFIKDIEIDEDIYPRTQRSQKTIDSYAESLEVDAEFPSLLVQRIKETIEDKGKEKVIGVL